MAEQKIQIEVGADVAGGEYSNLAMIAHNENEFVMDFIFVHPPKGKVNSRVITSPSHAKRLYRALGKNVEAYEKKFGAIKEAPEPPKLNVDFSKN
jgi:hypothetical protein